ncbi:hypothetical protein [Aliarcobacter butzleri]|uniref:hypothetical protein n=1 Tax=Aliarcobacter butzleri TaxID=28197 RepID=UPI003BB1D730
MSIKLRLKGTLKLPENFTEFHTDGKTQIWSKKTIKFEKSLLGQIVEIDKIFKISIESIPVPQSLEEKEFQLDIEQKYFDKINTLNQQIEEIKSQIEQKQNEFSKHSLSKKLLYENGKLLEYAIIEALQTIGFKVENYDTKGVLFGNQFRLVHPNEIKELFTQKAIESAKRTRIEFVNILSS